jgi:hypothetical protein
MAKIGLFNHQKMIESILAHPDRNDLIVEWVLKNTKNRFNPKKGEFPGGIIEVLNRTPGEKIAVIVQRPGHVENLVRSLQLLGVLAQSYNCDDRSHAEVLVGTFEEMKSTLDDDFHLVILSTMYETTTITVPNVVYFLDNGPVVQNNYEVFTKWCNNCGRLIRYTAEPVKLLNF